MLNQTIFDQLIGSVTKELPSHLAAFQQEIGQIVDQVLKRQFGDLNLVTREEWEAQMSVLAKTREKVDELEKHIKTLEQSLQNPPHPSSKEP